MKLRENLKSIARCFKNAGSNGGHCRRGALDIAIGNPAEKRAEIPRRAAGETGISSPPAPPAPPAPTAGNLRARRRNFYPKVVAYCALAHKTCTNMEYDNYIYAHPTDVSIGRVEALSGIGGQHGILLQSNTKTGCRSAEESM